MRCFDQVGDGAGVVVFAAGGIPVGVPVADVGADVGELVGAVVGGRVGATPGGAVVVVGSWLGVGLVVCDLCSRVGRVCVTGVVRFGAVAAGSGRTQR
ncbi:MAG: hypothetical protein ABI662_04930 [Dermatophilaceae bacterium]